MKGAEQTLFMIQQKSKPNVSPSLVDFISKSLCLLTTFVFNWTTFSGWWWNSHTTIRFTLHGATHARFHSTNNVTLHAITMFTRIFTFNGCSISIEQSILHTSILNNGWRGWGFSGQSAMIEQTRYSYAII